MPDILIWCQDSNWPVAHILTEFVASIGASAAPYIADVLRGNDDSWKWHVLSAIVAQSDAIALSLVNELERIAFSPSVGEVEEEVVERALHILKDNLNYKI